MLKVKGTHNAMKTGMLAAESAFEVLSKTDTTSETKGEAYANNYAWISIYKI